MKLPLRINEYQDGLRVCYSTVDASGVVLMDNASGHPFPVGFETQKRVAHYVNLMPDALKAIREAERFIRGFEDDEIQEGIGELLGLIRHVLNEQEEFENEQRSEGESR